LFRKHEGKTQAWMGVYCQNHKGRGRLSVDWFMRLRIEIRGVECGLIHVAENRDPWGWVWTTSGSS
jgi:hypothetical protein